MNLLEKKRKLKQDIREQITDSLSYEEIKHYVKRFIYLNTLDYNIAQYGNLLIYYTQIRDFYKEHGFDYSTKDDEFIWNLYKKDVGVEVRKILKEGSTY